MLEGNSKELESVERSQMSTRTYDHNGHTNLPIACPDWDDVEVAGRVRMLMRNDLDHELICTVARDRILCLAKEKERLSQLLLAARYLILAATGPDGGPTSWNETRDRWLALLDEHASVEGESRC